MPVLVVEFVGASGSRPEIPLSGMSRIETNTMHSQELWRFRIQAEFRARRRPSEY